jgi:hypothetical protein
VAGFCEHGDEPSGSVKKTGFFDELSDNQLFFFSNNILHHAVCK